VFVAAVTFLPRFYLANYRGIDVQTHRLKEGFIKHAVEMGSGALICIPSFIKIDSDIQKLIWGDTQTAW
jgi:hypothetical protein